MSHPKMIDRDNAALLMIDFQEAFRPVIRDFEFIAERISKMVTGCMILGVPVIFTEQYPKGLGLTAREISLSLPDDSDPIIKSTFSACGQPDLMKALSATGANQILLCGAETHICVGQTAHGLLDAGYQVHILEDMVSSRTLNDRTIGIAKMVKSGCIPASLESALFEMVKDSASAEFKEIQALIK